MRTLLLALLLAAPAAAPEPDGGYPLPAPPPQEPAPTRSWTLAQLLSLAHEQSPEVIDARLRAEQARAEVLTAGQRPNPQLQLGLSNLALGQTSPPGLGPGETLTPSAGVSQKLELGGERGLRLQSAQAGIEQGQAALAEARRVNRASVQAAFYRALAAQEHQRLAWESLSRYLDTVRLTRARVEAGELASADLNKIELESFRYLGEAQTRRLAAVQARAELFSQLGLTGSPESEAVEGNLAEPVTLPSGELPESAWAGRPDLQALRSAHARASSEASLARAQAIPDVDLGLTYSHSPPALGSGAINGLALQASLPLPFFNSNQGEIAKADLELQRTQAALRRGEADARREVQLAQAHLRTAEAIAGQLEQGYLQRAERARSLAERTYLEGHTSLLEVLEAQRTQLETRGAYLDALLERRLGAVELERALGAGEP